MTEGGIVGDMDTGRSLEEHLREVPQAPRLGSVLLRMKTLGACVGT